MPQRRLPPPAFADKTGATMSDTLLSFEPATGEELWRGAVSNVDDEVAIARGAWPEWAAKAVTFRTETLRRFADRVKAEGEVLADLIARETGKPLWEARTEVESVVAKVDVSVKSYGERTPNRRIEGAMGLRNAVRHKPHGALAVLGPYNFPAHLPNGHIVPALIAGNSVLFKPSEKTPAVGAKLVELFHSAGVPQEVLRLIVGGPDIGKALAGHEGIDGLLFTGSVRTGLALNRQFVGQPGKMLALEMGGNNPIVVWDTADIRTAAIIVVQSAFLSAGQRCSNARRLIVRDSLADALLEEVKALANRMIVDHPHADPTPYMGPVIDNEAADGLTESFLILMSNGGQVIRHMTRPVAGRPFLTPGIIDVTSMPERPDIELFGPLLQVVRVETFEAAIAEANNTAFGLSAALVGGTPQLYDQFWANARAGVINWNRPTNGASSAAPFGGIGLSGNHRPSAFYAADYCAYPVASAESDALRASIGVGLRDPEGARLIPKNYN
jgi:succinylglutamic semialdehyde dehydrogenase